MRIPKPYEKYKHFKGNCYQIICVAQHSETDEDIVVYQALYAPFKIYARPLDMFMSSVDRTKYPECQQEHRFELLDDEGFVIERKNISDAQDIMTGGEGETAPESTGINETILAERPKVEPTPEFHASIEQSEIDPLLERFLDAESIDDKIVLVQEEKDRMTPEILTPIELSLGMEPQEGTVAERCREIKNFLLIKQKYERQHR